MTSTNVRGLRIAFLTPEFVTEISDAGGLASYLGRMVLALRNAGHLPEVLTTSSLPPGTVDFAGVPVHRVSRSHAGNSAWSALLRRSRVAGIADHILCAWHLARRLEELERVRPFDLIQSTDYRFTGLFVHRRRSRPHIVRCSWIGDVFSALDGDVGFSALLATGHLERLCLRKADGVCAPSECVAGHYQRSHGLNVAVVRPPLSVFPTEADPPPLPHRFLLHFGQLGRRKGTDTVAAALPFAWAVAPDLQMVWAGKELTQGILAQSRALWGSQAANVFYAGALDRPSLLATVQRATATVLPSRLDNLPNTAIESLAVGVPVIGTIGASLDELVQDGVNGYLVPTDDPQALAQAMLRAWSMPEALSFVRPALFDEMTPERAVERFLDFALGCRPVEDSSPG